MKEKLSFQKINKFILLLLVPISVAFFAVYSFPVKVSAYPEDQACTITKPGSISYSWGDGTVYEPGGWFQGDPGSSCANEATAFSWSFDPLVDGGTGNLNFQPACPTRGYPYSGVTVEVGRCYGSMCYPGEAPGMLHLKVGKDVVPGYYPIPITATLDNNTIADCTGLGFTVMGQSVSATIDPAGGGTVVGGNNRMGNSLINCPGTCNSGNNYLDADTSFKTDEFVTFTATANAGYVFDHWTEYGTDTAHCHNSTNPICTFQTNYAVSVVAHFKYVPPTPTGLSVSASACNNGWLNLQWDTSVGADSYQVYRDGGASPITLAGYSCNATQCSGSDDNGGSYLTLGSFHSYRVRATNTNGSSAKSSSVPGTVASACPISAIGAKWKDNNLDTITVNLTSGQTSTGVIIFNYSNVGENGSVLQVTSCTKMSNNPKAIPFLLPCSVILTKP